MPKVAKGAAVFSIVCGLIIPIGSSSVCEKTEVTTPVSILVCAPNGNTGSHLGPVLLVVISNRTGASIVIDRHLSGVPIRTYNSLWVHIKDLKSGQEASPRASFRPIQMNWRQSDLLVLQPTLNYGPIINLEDYFLLKTGRAYSCKFEYRSIAPKKLGQLRPWNGTAVSRTVVVYP